MKRFLLVSTLVVSVVACSAGPTSPAPPLARPAVPSAASGATTVMYFEGSFDVASNALTVRFLDPVTGQVRTEATLPYGGSASTGANAGDVLFHTCGTPGYAGNTLSGVVQAVNNTAGSVTNLSVVIDSISDTGATFSTTPPGGNYGTVPSGNDHSCATHTLTWNFAQTAPTNFTFLGHATGGTAPTFVNLASSFTTEAYIINNPVTGSGLGIDGVHALSANELNVASAWSSGTIGVGGGVPFQMVFPSGSDVPNGIRCTGQTVALPAGNFSTLAFLAFSGGVSGNGQGPFNFTVNYAGGGTAVLTQPVVSDVGAPHGGDTIVSTIAHLETINNSGTQSGSWHIYEYNIPLNSAKTVASITLPSTAAGNGGVQLLAITLE